MFLSFYYPVQYDETGRRTAQNHTHYILIELDRIELNEDIVGPRYRRELIKIINKIQSI